MSKDITPERDAKLAELKKLIENKVKNPTTNTFGKPNRKVLVFTAFADMALYLYTVLHDWARKELGIHIALVSGGASECKTTFSKADFNHILIIGLPKTELISLFQRELGRTRKYSDRNHALLLAQEISEWSKLRRSDSFRRFAEKAARVNV